ARTDLFAFNPDRVLRDITKLVAVVPNLPACKDVGQYLQDKVVQILVTPVSAKGLMSLLDHMTQEPRNKASKQRH
ncbi:hypothetical protein CC78DRAFT_603692, partial [Lojkania enalia]